VSPELAEAMDRAMGIAPAGPVVSRAPGRLTLAGSPLAGATPPPSRPTPPSTPARPAHDQAALDRVMGLTRAPIVGRVGTRLCLGGVPK